jgi:hypothetical protein
MAIGVKIKDTGLRVDLDLGLVRSCSKGETWAINLLHLLYGVQFGRSCSVDVSHCLS